ncbi:hypothetical protein BC828DRAFT_63613 [Blastocladiella britannica]|nr:hypothetical protein BC828DRAFT_63613 [Blastocladiella britannica]
MSAVSCGTCHWETLGGSFPRYSHCFCCAYFRQLNVGGSSERLKDNCRRIQRVRAWRRQSQLQLLEHHDGSGSIFAYSSILISLSGIGDPGSSPLNKCQSLFSVLVVLVCHLNKHVLERRLVNPKSTTSPACAMCSNTADRSVPGSRGMVMRTSQPWVSASLSLTLLLRARSDASTSWCSYRTLSPVSPRSRCSLATMAVTIAGSHTILSCSLSMRQFV